MEWRQLRPPELRMVLVPASGASFHVYCDLIRSYRFERISTWYTSATHVHYQRSIICFFVQWSVKWILSIPPLPNLAQTRDKSISWTSNKSRLPINHITSFNGTVGMVLLGLLSQFANYAKGDWVLLIPKTSTSLQYNCDSVLCAESVKKIVEGSDQCWPILATCTLLGKTRVLRYVRCLPEIITRANHTHSS